MTVAECSVHASTVAVGGRAVLLIGPSGAGKSDLALRLIDRGGMLVADDYTVLTPRDGALVASPPASIAGRIEVRGVGIIAMPYREAAPVALAILLGQPEERLPEPRTIDLAGVAVPALALNPFTAAAPIKVERALQEMAA